MKYTFMFPGQAYFNKVNSIRRLYENNSVVREVFTRNSEISGIDIYQMCISNYSKSIENLNAISLSVFSLGEAMFRYVNEVKQITPSIMIGHSLGEITALVCAGSCSANDAIKIINYRADLAKRVHKKNDSRMLLAYNIPKDTVEMICRNMRKKGEQIWISCLNSDVQASVAGTQKSLNIFSGMVHRKGGYVQKLEYNGAFHSPMLNGVLEEFKEFIDPLDLTQPKIPVMSAVTLFMYSHETIKKNLALQLVSPIRWRECIKKCISMNCNLYIEMGLGNVLQNLLLSEDADSHKAGLELQKELFMDSPRLFAGGN